MKLDTFIAPVRTILARREFIWHLSAHELRSIYRDTALGLLWTILRPLIQLGAYLFILTTLFRAQPSEFTTSWQYAGYICTGLAVWQFVQKSLEDATTLIRSRQDIIRQMVFPIETLPCINMATCSIGPLLILSIGLGINLVLGEVSPWALVAVPAFLVLLLACVVGSAWIFMIVGALLRDLREIVAVLFGLLVYASPVILTRSMVSEGIWKITMLNPLSHVVIAFRDALAGTFHGASWTILAVWAVASWCGGAVCVRYAQNRINEYA